MKKTLLLFSLLSTFIFSNAQTVGDTFTVDDIDYTVTSLAPNEAEVSGSTLANVVVPASVDDVSTTTTYSVTAIGANAFDASATLMSMTLPSSVTLINQNAFISCHTLTSINTENITQILIAGFRDCDGITSLDLSSLESVAENGLSRMDNITSLNLPSITTIDQYSFVFSNSIETINIGSSLSSISHLAFTGLAGIQSIQVNTDTPVEPSEAFAFPQATTDSAVINFFVPSPTAEFNYGDPSFWGVFTNTTVGALSTEESQVELDFSIFPNPTSGNISIKNDKLRNADITVYDLRGVKVKRENISRSLTTIDISNLASGMYVLKVQTENSDFIKRIVKQ